jgi:hypothetical protein
MSMTLAMAEVVIGAWADQCSEVKSRIRRELGVNFSSIDSALDEEEKAYRNVLALLESVDELS